ncbi:MAG: hypothetical protein ACRDQ4_21150 [Pseudonocardiaceae bacterium]
MANLATADSAAAAPSMVPKTTTGETLRVLRTLLLIVTVMVGGTSWSVFQKVHSTVETVHSTTAPAIRDVLAAREALAEADSAAVDSFRKNEVKLIGPGLEYQTQLTIARQRLIQVAAERTAAGKDSQRIQLLEALLESYSGLIGQAQAHVGTAVGIADLWSASHLLHAGDSPILDELDSLAKEQADILNDQITASSTTTANLLMWVIPIALLFVLLFALLVATQVFLRSRFRRAVNWPLLFSTLALIGLFIVTSSAGVSERRLENSRASMTDIVHIRQEQLSAANTQGQQVLGELMKKECGGANGGCGPTVDQFVSRPQPTGSATEEISDKRLTKRMGDFDDDIKSAGEYADGKYAIPILTGLIFLLISLGLWPRIEEYRYRLR